MVVTCVGLGGEGILRTHQRDQEARRVIEEALREGIRYCDSARAYAGSESYYGQVWRQSPRDREEVFQTSKSAARDREGARRDLERTLANLGIGRLDLWQIHDVRTREDLYQIAGPGGALEAFVKAKAEGLTRLIGVTGHHDPDILTQAVREWPVDAVMMPVNPVEGALGGFLDETLPAALEKGLAVIGMKVLGASHYLAPQTGVDAGLLIRFALSFPLSVAIVGCSTPAHVRTLADAARDGQTLNDTERNQLIDRFRPAAARLAFYRGARPHHDSRV
jgi:aryl-alcohol dehydrogenase-like predicted oxidoreductase